MNISGSKYIRAILPLILLIVVLVSTFLILLAHAPVHPQSAAPPIAGVQNVGPLPTPATGSWSLLANTSFGYRLRYPTVWTVRDLGQVDNESLHMVTFSAPGQAVPDTISLRITKRSFSNELDLVSDELGNQPPQRVKVAGLTGAQFIGRTYDGEQLRAVILPTMRYTYIVTVHYSNDADPRVTTFEQILASLQLSNPQFIYLPITIR